MTYEQQLESNRRWREAHPDYYKNYYRERKENGPKYWDNDLYRAKRRRYAKNRYKTDEAYREKRKQQSRDYRMKKKMSA